MNARKLHKGKQRHAVGRAQQAAQVDELRRQLADALAQQAATREILKTISRSSFELGSVLEALIENAVRLCAAESGVVYRFDGSVHRLVAAYRISPQLREFVEANPIPPGPGTAVGRAALERRTVHIPDIAVDPDYRYPAAYTLGSVRSILGVPMVREDVPIGVMTIWRNEVRPFTVRQIDLLTAFSDQAAIAIENARLFNELERRNRALAEALDQQTATSEILRVISRSPTDVQPVFDAIAHAALALCRAVSANVLTFDGELLHLAARASAVPDTGLVLKVFPRPAGTDTVAGRAVLTRRVTVIPDVANDPDYTAPARHLAELTGARSFLGVPLMRDGVPIGALGVGRPETGNIPEQQIALLQTFADQAVIAIQNARLFHEIEEKGRQLEIANQHKSAFLANMSHELRTPLNAVIGFSQMLAARYFGELTDKQAEYVDDIIASGKHLLSLINDILDLSKIDAGRMELEAGEFDLPATLANALTLVRERAQRGEVALRLEIDPALRTLRGDERKLKQVLLNLLSNAVKFTPRGGEVRLRAQGGDGFTRIAVSDTGVGIASEDQALIFEAFRQVGTSVTHKREGTGLGLALARRFVELHGGSISVESAPGAGSTFTVQLPLRHGQ